MILALLGIFLIFAYSSFLTLGGLYIKFDENEVYELSDSVEHVSVPPEKEVRALDTELHINGVKKF